MVGEELSPALGPDTSLRQIKGGKGGERKKKERDKLQNVHVACDDKSQRKPGHCAGKVQATCIVPTEQGVWDTS